MFICKPCMDGVHNHIIDECKNMWTDSTCDCKQGRPYFRVSKAVKHGFRVLDGAKPGSGVRAREALNKVRKEHFGENTSRGSS